MGAVTVRVHDAGRAIGTLAGEANGVRCILIAGDLLAAVERFRLVRASPAAMDDALARLAAPDCAALVAGPRVLGVLKTSELTMVGFSGRTDQMKAATPLGDAVLALFQDVADASKLTYDANVETVNLEDALAVRIPGASERLAQSAQLLNATAGDNRLGRGQIIAVAKLLGQAQDMNATANDDFEGALITMPDYRPVLGRASDEADRSQAALAVAIDRHVAAARAPDLRDGFDNLRAASIAAGTDLLRAGARVMLVSFDARTRALRRVQERTVAVGAIVLSIGCTILALLWRELRRRDRSELERAHERAQILETKLARHNAERALRLTEQQFRAVFDGSNVGIAIVNAEVTHVDGNAALTAMLGDDLPLIGIKAREMLSAVDRDRRHSRRSEHCFVKSNGERLWAELSLSVVGGESDERRSAIVLVHDITEHKMLNARLDHETLHDALTKLPNRVHLIRRLDAMIGYGDPFTVVFIDLDGFKVVNDTLGHHVGDDVLQLAAQRLVAAVRPADFVARLHGDEFAVIVGGLGSDTFDREIDDIVGRVHAALDMRVDAPAAPLRVTASIGYVRDGAGYGDSEKLLGDADSAMYRSKRDGRDRITAYSPHSTRSSA